MYIVSDVTLQNCDGAYVHIKTNPGCIMLRNRVIQQIVRIPFGGTEMLPLIQEWAFYFTDFTDFQLFHRLFIETYGGPHTTFLFS